MSSKKSFTQSILWAVLPEWIHLNNLLCRIAWIWGNGWSINLVWHWALEEHSFLSVLCFYVSNELRQKTANKGRELYNNVFFGKSGKDSKTSELVWCCMSNQFPLCHPQSTPLPQCSFPLVSYSTHIWSFPSLSRDWKLTYCPVRTQLCEHIMLLFPVRASLWRHTINPFHHTTQAWRRPHQISAPWAAEWVLLGLI